MPYDYVGNWHDIDEDGVGVTDGPRGGFWDADGNLYLADFTAMQSIIMLITRKKLVLMNLLPMPEPF